MNTDELINELHALEDKSVSLSVIPAPDEVDTAWCLRFLRAIRDTAFATVDETGRPNVRIIDVMAVSKSRLYFLAPRGKAFHADVMREGFVAIVGQTPDFRTCRLRGEATRIDEKDQHAFVDALFALNPGMDILYPEDRRYICDVFYIENGEGEYFDLGQQPIFRKAFRLGDASLVPHSYIIDGTCIECGRCAQICPESCIEAGCPYKIDQTHCLQCGLCVEVCPTYSIVKQK